MPLSVSLILDILTSLTVLITIPIIWYLGSFIFQISLITLINLWLGVTLGMFTSTIIRHLRGAKDD